jgi:hypothetical protein
LITVRQMVGNVYGERWPGHGSDIEVLIPVWGATVPRHPLSALLVPWRCTDPPESLARYRTPADGACLRWL